MGRGVAIYMHASLTSTVCKVQDDPRDLELLWVRIVMGGGVVLVGALYHPPKPCYEKGVLIDFIERSLEELLAVDMGAEVILGGDFNKLNVEEVSIRTGLVSLVKVSTRGGKILDMLMTSIPANTTSKSLRQQLDPTTKLLSPQMTEKYRTALRHPQSAAFVDEHLTRTRPFWRACGSLMTLA